MKLELLFIKEDDKEILKNLLELYNYDSTDYDNRDVNKHGLYGYSYLDHYWTEENF